MRIWLLTSELPSGIAAGIARYVDTFARLLSQDGHEVVVFAPGAETSHQSTYQGVRLVSSSSQAGEPQVNHIAKVRLPPSFLGHFTGISYEMAETVLRCAEDLGPPDIIESQEFAALPYFLLQRKLTERTCLERTPVLVHLHGPLFEIARINGEPRYQFPGYWVGQMEKFCVVAADALLSPSAFLINWLEVTLGRSLEAVHVPLPLCLDENAGESERVPESRHLVYVGRLEVRKGVLPLVDACSRLWAAGEDFRLSLIGQDCSLLSRDTTVGTFLRRTYTQWIDSGYLTLVGPADHRSVMDFMKRAWAVLIPSQWENFPNTCMEAMGLGRVVVASRTGGQAEMIERDGEEGFLFDWQNAGDFEDTVRNVLRLRAEELSRIGQTAQERIRTLCGPQAVLQKRLEHYSSVIAAHVPRRYFPTLADSAASTRRPEPALPPRAEPQNQLLSVIISPAESGVFTEEALRSMTAIAHSPLEFIVPDEGIDERRMGQLLGLPRVAGSHSACSVRRGDCERWSWRLAAADAARGAFIAFVEADECVEADFFTRAIDVLKRYSNVGFVYSWVSYLAGASNTSPTWNAEFPYLLARNMPAGVSVTRRSEFLRCAPDLPGDEVDRGLFETWIRLVREGWVGVSLPHSFVSRRTAPEARVGCTNEQLYVFDVITQSYGDLYSRWAAELVNLLNANGPAYLWSDPAEQMSKSPQIYLGALRGIAHRLSMRLRHLADSSSREPLSPQALSAAIEELARQSNDLLGLLEDDVLAGSPHVGGAWALDYDLGARVIARVRSTWLARQVLRHTTLKQALKRVLRV